jgi:putative membrane protein
VQILSEAQRKQIAGSIAAAEATTSGEIYVVVARRSADFTWVMLLWAAVAAVMIPLSLLLAGVDPGARALALLGGWRVGHAGSSVDAASWAVGLMLVGQTAIFIAAVLLGRMFPGALVPSAWKRQAVHRAALDQFMAHGIEATDARTGVLIYVSLAERIVEIVADTGIHSRVAPGTWSTITAGMVSAIGSGDLAGGIERAIAGVGERLAEHFPPGPDNEDELPDRVVVI